ncbi:MAG: VWA domain-containing protein [Lentisphaeria bacterium]|nr:VWA domain-containing protein [Lentisphaeria bacterium]
MKNIETPNNNPFLSGIVFLLMIFAAIVLFAAAREFADAPAGLGDGSGIGVFGSGVGDGIGAGKGSGAQDGDSKGKGDSAGGREDGEGTSGDDSGKAPGTEPEKKAETGGKTSESPAPEPKKDKAEKRPQSGGTFAGEQIFVGGDTPGGETHDDGGASSGKPSFSSGGRSVFRVRKHENALFVVDVSSSMNSLTSERLPRIEVLKIQLKAILSQQRHNGSVGKYGILAFSYGTTYFPSNGQQMRFGSRTDFEAAEKWIDKLDKLPRGGTPIYEAMQRALAMAKNKNMSIDAIYLLTDGDPTDVSDITRYVELIKKELPRKVKIHTIAIGMHSALLEQIAKTGNGNYDRYQ